MAFSQRTAMGSSIGDSQASTSGASIDFTGIPLGSLTRNCRLIIVQFVGVSMSGNDDILVQLGGAGGIETSGYLASSSTITNAVGSTTYTTGIGIRTGDITSGVLHGSVILTLEDAANFTWVASGVLARSDTAATITVSGSKSTSDTLDRLRVVSGGGVVTFDAGKISLQLEF